MANSNLITHGLGGTLITHGLGGITVEVEQPVVSGFRGGGSSQVVPQAVLVAKALVKIKHVNPTVSRFRVLTQNLIVKSTIPVKIRKIAISFKAITAGLSIKSFVQGLSLSISNEGIDIDESKS